MRTVSRALPLLVALIAATAATIPDMGMAATLGGLGDLPGGADYSRALAVSRNGSVVVGSSYSTSGCEAFRWTASGGIVGLGDLPGGVFWSGATAVSADGSVIVGESNCGSGAYQAFRWTASEGMVGLGDLPGGEFKSFGNGVSDDGSVIVGYGTSASGREPFRWTASEQMISLRYGGEARGVSGDGSVVVGQSGNVAYLWTGPWEARYLGDLPGGQNFGSAYAASADGSVIVGESSSATTTEAFRWTASGGMVGLGCLPDGSWSQALGVSADGSAVVGVDCDGSSFRAIFWTSALGMRNLTDLLSPALPAGWTLSSANGVTLNGSAVTVVGEGHNPSGYTEAWIATFTIPEPASLLTLASALLGLAAVVRRKRACNTNQ